MVSGASVHRQLIVLNMKSLLYVRTRCMHHAVFPQGGRDSAMHATQRLGLFLIPIHAFFTHSVFLPLRASSDRE